jgi:Peptidase family M23/Trypsin-like peptidase domain
MNNFYKKIFLIATPIILSVIIVVLQPLVTIGMIPSQVSDEIAKKVTVSIEGDNSGSGVIIGKNNSNNYQVMTASHVIERKGKYLIRTFDNKSYLVNTKSIKRMENIDIAIVEFTSEIPYLVANLGDSNILKEGMTVFIAGYPANGPSDSGRNYNFLASRITTLLKKPRDGYSLGYDNFSVEGMSGGAVLNEDGKLVAIHGLTEIRRLTGPSGNYGIPSNLFKNWHQQIALIPQKNTPSDSEVLINNSFDCEKPPVTPNIEFIWPTYGVITSRFGRRWGKMNKNPGIDIASSIGTPIHAVADGIVEAAGWNDSGYGNLVVIRHVNGLLTYYGHNSELSVKVNEHVNQGDIIALMGSTGSSSYSHLHFEVRQLCPSDYPSYIFSTKIAPLPFFPKIKI